MWRRLRLILISCLLLFFGISCVFSNIQHVKGYTRKDGKIIHSYYRSRADGVTFNNIGKYINYINKEYFSNKL